MVWHNKEAWEHMSSDLREAIWSILERQQRHIAILEAEVARLKELLPPLVEEPPQRAWKATRPLSAHRPQTRSLSFSQALEGKKEHTLARRPAVRESEAQV